MGQPDIVKQRIRDQFDRRRIPPEQIESVVEIIARASTLDERARLVKFWVHGQPDPDAVVGTIRAPVETVGEVVDALVNNELVANGALPLQVTVDINPFNQGGDVSFGPFMIFGNGQPSLDAIRDTE